MKKHFVLIFGALSFFSLCATGLAGEGSMRAFTRSDNKKSVDIQLGQDFAIGLPAQPGTGYVWKVTSLPQGVTQTGEDMTGGDDSAALGRPERMILKFKATGAGRGRVVVVYVRPWETSASPAETFELDVNVKQ